MYTCPECGKNSTYKTGSCQVCRKGVRCATCDTKTLNIQDSGKCFTCHRITPVLCEHPDPVTFLGYCVICVADNRHTVIKVLSDNRILCTVCGDTESRPNGKDGPVCRRSQNFTVKSNRYGGSRSSIKDLYIKSGGACLICGSSEGARSLHVDHDHSCCASTPTCGECTRGLLCDLHNRLAGFLEHPDRDAVEMYLKEFKGED